MLKSVDRNKTNKQKNFKKPLYFHFIICESSQSMFLKDRDEDFILYKRDKKTENFLSECERKSTEIKCLPWLKRRYKDYHTSAYQGRGKFARLEEKRISKNDKK